MLYNILKITSYYPNFLRTVYRQNLSLSKKSYQYQYEYLMKQFFGWADSYEFYLSKFGHKANQIIYNAQSLQLAWAKEHNIRKINHELLFEQIKFYNPNILFLEDISIATKPFLKRVKDICPNLKLILTYVSSPVTINNESLNYIDIVLSPSKKICIEYIKKGLKSEVLELGFDERILKNINFTHKKNAIVFAGNIIDKIGYHQARKDFLQNFFLSSNIPYEIYTQNKNLNLKNINNEVYGIEYFNILSQYTISINKHIDISNNIAGNMRMYETTGLGTCLLTDHLDNISELFEVDTEIVTYSTLEEAIEKGRWLLNNPKKAYEIAKAGQKRTLTYYNYEKRVNKFLDILKKNI